MNPTKYIFLLLFTSFAFSQKTTYTFSLNESEKLNNELKIALEKDWKIFNYTIGDITNDKKNDIIVIAESEKNQLQSRKIFLFTCINDNLFELKATNQDIIECRICGVDGINDAFKGTSIEKSTFSFEFQYGTGCSSMIHITFKYDKMKKDWFLINETEVQYSGGSDNNGKIDYNKEEKFKKQYHKITFENFKLI